MVTVSLEQQLLRATINCCWILLATGATRSKQERVSFQRGLRRKTRVPATRYIPTDSHFYFSAWRSSLQQRKDYSLTEKGPRRQCLTSERNPDLGWEEGPRTFFQSPPPTSARDFLILRIVGRHVHHWFSLGVWWARQPARITFWNLIHSRGFLPGLCSFGVHLSFSRTFNSSEDALFFLRAARGFKKKYVISKPRRVAR